MDLDKAATSMSNSGSAGHEEPSTFNQSTAVNSGNLDCGNMNLDNAATAVASNGDQNTSEDQATPRVDVIDALSARVNERPESADNHSTQSNNVSSHLTQSNNVLNHSTLSNNVPNESDSIESLNESITSQTPQTSTTTPESAPNHTTQSNKVLDNSHRVEPPVLTSAHPPHMSTSAPEAQPTGKSAHSTKQEIEILMKQAQSFLNPTATKQEPEGDEFEFDDRGAAYLFATKEDREWKLVSNPYKSPNSPHDSTSDDSSSSDYESSSDESEKSDGNEKGDGSEKGDGNEKGDDDSSSHENEKGDGNEEDDDDSSSDENEKGDEDEEDDDDEISSLSPAAMAKMLMLGDGGLDDEAERKAQGALTYLRTKNEVVETLIEKPDVTITNDLPLEELGVVESIVENTVVIKAKKDGENGVVGRGAVLCLEDRSVIGAISETFGRVQEPRYAVLFNNPAEISEAGLELGTKVLYSLRHSKYLFTNDMKNIKGSDASNIYDEEVNENNRDFSDDEEEEKHKRKMREEKQAKRGRGGRSQQIGRNKRRALYPQQRPHDATRGINYDEAEHGPYRPLTRPAGFANAMVHYEAPQEGSYQAGVHRYTHGQNRENFRGLGRVERGRGRGDRGTGREDRGRGGGYQDRPGSSSGGYQNRPGSSGGYQHRPGSSGGYLNRPGSSGGYQDRPGSSGGYQNRPGSSGGYSLPPQLQSSYSHYQGQNPFPLPPQTNTNISMGSSNSTAYSHQQPQTPAWPQFPPQAYIPQYNPTEYARNLQAMYQAAQPNTHQTTPPNPQQGMLPQTGVNPTYNPQGGAVPPWRDNNSGRGRGRGGRGGGRDGGRGGGRGGS